MILLLVYCAVLLSFVSGLLALMMNRRRFLVVLTQKCFKKYPNTAKSCQELIFRSLDEQRFPVFLRQTVFVLLGLSGLFAVLAGLSVLISKDVITDQTIQTDGNLLVGEAFKYFPVALLVSQK